MKFVIASLLLFIGVCSFGSTLISEDYDAVKSVVLEKSSKVMMKDNLIKSELHERDLFVLNVKTDILNYQDFVVIEAVVLPEESNCLCQDVFEIKMELFKKENHWQVVRDSLKLVRIEDEQ
ncbi:hypothetical protein HBN50_09110 [Halobacteriovorax sp. GB3]|uniref:hypothetical protein n=1 Tax=Halobacteriovorax sp. GB3 TaxID=2719615 RepID=UPI00235E1C06|nr:hypothetical protein [Halobacteriovorax sp. GB3]MDD0853256.1 hypothetical protein [Halobacteriovorax sp. GB3]